MSPVHAKPGPGIFPPPAEGCFGPDAELYDHAADAIDRVREFAVARDLDPDDLLDATAALWLFGRVETARPGFIARIRMAFVTPAERREAA